MAIKNLGLSPGLKAQQHASPCYSSPLKVTDFTGHRAGAVIQLCAPGIPADAWLQAVGFPQLCTEPGLLLSFLQEKLQSLQL